MTPDAFRRLALALPETHEEPHFERTSFRVGKKIFATLVPDGGEAMIKLPAAEEAEDWIAARPELFFSYGTWTTRNGALGLHLRRVPVKLAHQLLEEAWRTIAPRRTLKAVEGGEPKTRRARRPPPG